MVAIQFKCTYNRYRKLTVWHRISQIFFVTLHTTYKPSVQFCNCVQRYKIHRLFCNDRFPVIAKLLTCSSMLTLMQDRPVIRIWKVRRWTCPVLPPHRSVHGIPWESSIVSLPGQYLGHGSSTSNTKFMDLKFQWLKQHIEMKVSVLHYLTTHDMIADFFASPCIG